MFTAFLDSSQSDAAARAAQHIVDALIEERTLKLSRSPLWPLFRPLAYQILHYRAARAMADRITPMGAQAAFDHISALLSLDVRVSGLEHLPRDGAFLIAPNHPTGIADGIAMFDALKARRADMMFFANRDALRVNPRFADMIIPVEWRAGEKSRAKSRDTLVAMNRAFEAGKAIVLFPAGRIAYWSDAGLTERPWQHTIVGLARRYGVPIVPVAIRARNSGMFYFFGDRAPEFRDMTVFHELLNKKKAPFDIAFSRPLSPDELPHDPAEAAASLQDFVTTRLIDQPSAEY